MTRRERAADARFEMLSRKPREVGRVRDHGPGGSGQGHARGTAAASEGDPRGAAETEGTGGEAMSVRAWWSRWRGRHNARLREVDMRELWPALVRISKEDRAKAIVAFSLHVARDRAWSDLTPEQIAQVVANLASNDAEPTP